TRFSRDWSSDVCSSDLSDEPGLLLGDSPQIRKLRTQTKKLARSQAPVFISGESGSGKELVARMIHLQGPRSDGPFVAVNCGAIPSELMESEFFRSEERRVGRE